MKWEGLGWNQGKGFAKAAKKKRAEFLARFLFWEEVFLPQSQFFFADRPDDFVHPLE